MTTNVKTVIRSANASAAITAVADPITTLWTVPLPAIVASGASGAGQVNAGDVVAVYNKGVPIGPVRVVDAADHRLSVINAGFGFTFVAGADLNWYRVATAAALAAADIVASGVVAITAIGSHGATAIQSGATPAAWLAIMLPDGTTGYMPYWQ